MSHGTRIHNDAPAPLHCIASYVSSPLDLLLSLPLLLAQQVALLTLPRPCLQIQDIL